MGLEWWSWLRKIGFMNKQRLGDVRVIGLVAGTHLIEDIARDVPHGVTVTIPGELAVRSKDLWRAIAQKCIFQLPSASPPLERVAAQAVDPERPRLDARIRELEDQIRSLEGENKGLRGSSAQSDDRDQKLDSILAALQTGAVFSSSFPSGVPIKKQEVADGTAPTFLPSEIRSRDMDARIDIQSESSVSGVSEAAERLRKIRQGGA
jgi:hypothetical protein